MLVLRLYSISFHAVEAQGEVDSRTSVGFYGEYVPPESETSKPTSSNLSQQTMPSQWTDSKEEGRITIEENTPTSENSKSNHLPAMGESFKSVYNILGSFLITVGFFLLFFKKKKEKEENI